MNPLVMTHDELKCERKRLKKIKNKTKEDIVSLYKLEREIIFRIRPIECLKNHTYMRQ